MCYLSVVPRSVRLHAGAALSAGSGCPGGSVLAEFGGGGKEQIPVRWLLSHQVESNGSRDRQDADARAAAGAEHPG